MPIQASAPFELVCIDFLHLDACQGGWNYVLLVTDHFTRFTQAYATKDNSSTSAANKLFFEFVLHFGFPKAIHHDRGGEFNSSLFQELHWLAGIRISNTTPYHPMGNGEVERLNRTGYSPFFLLFGRESRLPIDTIMPLEPQRTTRKTYDRFVKNWKDSLRDAQQVASQNIERAAAANKQQYDQRIKHVAIEVGDRVLVRNLTPRGGTGKLRSW